MTETIQQLKEDIAILQEKLRKLEALEKTKTPAEEAWKKYWGDYPTNPNEQLWKVFQTGYNDAYYNNAKESEDTAWKNVALKFGKKLPTFLPYNYDELSPNAWYRWVVFTYDNYMEQRDIECGYTPKSQEVVEKLQEKEWNVDVKTNLKPHWEPKPQEPEEVKEGFKEAFRESVKQGVVSFSTKPQTLYDVIADWWDEIFTNGNPSGQNIESLVEQIVKLVPDAIINPDEECDYGYNKCRYDVLKKFKGW